MLFYCVMCILISLADLVHVFQVLWPALEQCYTVLIFARSLKNYPGMIQIVCDLFIFILNTEWQRRIVTLCVFLTGYIFDLLR